MDTCAALNSGAKTLADIGNLVATLDDGFRTTAILEAGRRSIDAGGKPVQIVYGDVLHYWRPTDLVLL